MAEPTARETLFEYYNSYITATADEIAAWWTLDPVDVADGLGVDNYVVTSVGLFGYDLTDFRHDCTTLERLF